MWVEPHVALRISPVPVGSGQGDDERGTQNGTLDDLSARVGRRRKRRPGSFRRLIVRPLSPHHSRSREALAMFLRILDRLEEILIATLIAAATLLIFVAVVHRYASGIPFLYPSIDRKSTRLNSSHLGTSYAVFCWKKTTRPPG